MKNRPNLTFFLPFVVICWGICFQFLHAQGKRTWLQGKAASEGRITENTISPRLSHDADVRLTNGWEEFELISVDSLLAVFNHDVTRIFAELNEYRFILTTHSAELGQGDNIFLIAEQDTTVINIGAYLNPEGITVMRLLAQGPAGSTAEIFIADLHLPGRHSSDYVLWLTELPKTFLSAQNYPNPFNDVTIIRYTVPQEYLFGTDVELVVYNALGQQIKTLVSAKQFPGTFDIKWRGKGERGQRVASGLYFYRIRIAGRQVVKRMILLR